MGDFDQRFVARVLAFVRGEADTPDIEGSGLRITVGLTSTVVHEPAGLPVVTPSAADIARGLLSHHERDTARDWAKVMLTLNLIDLVALERAGDAGERLLDALWSASAEEPIAPAVLDGARELESPRCVEQARDASSDV
jgi:hypothetical protein